MACQIITLEYDNKIKFDPWEFHEGKRELAPESGLLATSNTHKQKHTHTNTTYKHTQLNQ